MEHHGLQISVGDKIKLKGKTRHGKNRVHEHGDIWVVIKGPALIDQGWIRVGQVCIEPVERKSGLDTRWIMPVNDRDFEILDKVA